MRQTLKGPLPFLCVGHSIDHMFMLLYPTVVLALEAQMGRSYGELLALSTVGFVMFGAGAPLAGWLADRWSNTGVMAVFFIGIGLSAVLTGFATEPWMFVVTLGLIGLFASIYHPVGIPMIVETAGGSGSQGRQLGINGVFGSGGMAMAPLVAGGLTALIDWRAAFIVPGLVSIALGIVFALRFPRPIRTEGGQSRKGAAVPLDRKALIRVLLVLAVITMCAGMVFQALTVGLPKIVDRRITFAAGSEFGIGGIVTIILLIGGFAQLLGGILADRFPLKWLFLAIYGGMAPVLLLATQLSEGAMMLALVMVIAITVGNQPVSDGLFARFIPPRWLSTAFGFRFALSLGVSAIAVLVVGGLFDLTGDFNIHFLLMAVLAVTVVLAILLLPPEPAKVAKPDAAPAARPLPAAE